MECLMRKGVIRMYHRRRRLRERLFIRHVVHEQCGHACRDRLLIQARKRSEVSIPFRPCLLTSSCVLVVAATIDAVRAGGAQF